MSAIRYASVPLDDEFDEEFIDQGGQLLEDDLDTTSYEHQPVPPAQNCCQMPKLTDKCACDCAIRKCSKMTKIVLSVVIIVLFSALCIGLGYLSVFVLTPTPVLDKSYHAFSIPNHEASLNFEAFKLASTHNATWRHVLKKRSLSNNPFDSYFNHKSHEDTYHRSKREIIDSYVQYNVQWKMQIVFLAQGEDENIFTKDRLEYIHEIEKKIMNHTKFKDFCFKDYSVAQRDPSLRTINNCAPLNSLMQYFYPTMDENQNIHYDGLGSKLADIESTIQFAMATSDHFYYFVDQNVNKTHHKSKLLRTEVLFGSPLKGYLFSSIKRKEQSEKFKDFVLSYVELLSSASTDKVRILYGGNEIFDYEVNSIFWNDVKLASFSLAAIFVFMLVLTSFSLWLTFFGIASILLCFPLAVFFYHTVFSVAAFGILNGVAAFVIIGIGVDDVFVFINIFRQSTNMKTIDERVKHTLKIAGKATFFTSFTTAAAFAANTASSIPAVHQFGLFMSLIVSCCWITVVVIMPPALYIWGVGIQHWEEKCLSWICCKFNCETRELPADIVAFVGGKSHQSDIQQVGRNLPQAEEEDDDDVPLLTLDDPMEFFIERYGAGDDDEVLLIPDRRNINPQSPQPESRKQKISLIQAFLYRCVALPVIKMRRIIIGISLLIMIASIVLITRLHPSTKPPQIFKADTNLQQLMDLKTSMGIIDEISCYKCSAIYDVDEKDVINPFKSTFSPVGTTRIPIPTTTKQPTTPAVQVLPQIITTPMNRTVKAGESVVFRCDAIGQPIPVLYWLKDGKNSIPGKATQRTYPHYQAGLLIIDYVRKHDEGTYSCTATNAIGQTHVSARLSVIDVPTTQVPVHPIPNTPSEIIPVTESPDIDRPTPKSIPEDYDMCKNTDCTKAKARPMLETGATVYVVFGITGLDKSEVEPGHVMDKNQGKVLFDADFNKHFKLIGNLEIMAGLSALCKVCKEIASRTDLVKNGSAQCFPSRMPWNIDTIPDCQNLPHPVEVYGRQAPAHVIGGLDANQTGILWWAFAFESTTSKSQSYFEAYKEYLKWDKLITKIRKELKSTPYLQSVFQTSEFWPQVMMEIVAVNSAIYSLVLSMVICLVAVAIFTSHATLLLIVFITILEMICLVAGIFYLAGWEMGGVEAISLSILVGSSVDYCVHLVEGFLLAGQAVPEHLKNGYAGSRQWRTKAAISHIGMSIFSSAVTTIVAAIPLTQTTIQPFAKFGQILAINSSVAIIYCLTVCSALLAFMGPSKFISSWKSTIKMTVGVFVVVGLSTLVLFVISRCGIFIPGPNGASLFPN